MSVQSCIQRSKLTTSTIGLNINKKKTATTLVPIVIILFQLLLIINHNCAIVNGQFVSYSEKFLGGVIKSGSSITIGNVVEPTNIDSDIVIERGGQLLVAPGAELRFAPGVGIKVFGALIAKGYADRKIQFVPRIGNAPATITTPQYGQPIISSSNTAPQWPVLRLVDGLSPLEGRLQVKYNDRWHSVCTGSKNWTLADAEVVCRQLGFAGGHPYQWFLRFNDSRQFSLERPGCTGREHAIDACTNWSQRKVGGGICDHHPDMGIRCIPYAGVQPNYWKGIQFYEAEYTVENAIESRLKRRVSKSVLEHAVLTYAGIDSNGKRISAVHVEGVPPTINHLDVRWSAYNGINITDPQEAVDISSSLFYQNRGYGVFVNTSWGRVTLNDVQVEGSGADGVRYTFYQKPVFGKEEFCSSADLGRSQVYPLRLTYTQTRFHTARQTCCRMFEVDEWLGHQLTVHFPVMVSWDPEQEDQRRTKEAEIKVYDGYSQELMASFRVRNQTRPQSITSTRGKLKICLLQAIYRQLMLTVDVTIDYGRAYDLNVTGSTITRNNGRGIWMENIRSGAVVNHSLIFDNDYAAGIHVYGGAGDLIVNNSQIARNQGDGINVTLAGGYKHIDRTMILNNTGRGLAFHYNESDEFLSFNFTHHVSRSMISGNLDVGLLIGNVCRSDSFWNVSLNLPSDSFWNISLNHFSTCNREAIKVLSCWNQQNMDPHKTRMTSLFISHNQFINNKRHAIKIAPALFIKSMIEHNAFNYHELAAIYINNRDALLYNDVLEYIPASVIIRENHFRHNRGQYVASIGLQESRKQSILFTKNTLEQNAINEPFPSLSPRSRVAAVVCVSSSNVIVVRNRFNNPFSKYDFGSHVENHDGALNASFNYWGLESNATHIYERIFDRKNRYNLARVEFLQYLTRPEDLDTREAFSHDFERDKIMSFRNGLVIGGEVAGDEFIFDGDYIVKKDIYVRPGGKLVISPGTILRFDQAVGLMVQGKIEIKGEPNRKVRFTSWSGPTLISPDAPVLKPILLDRNRNRIPLLNISSVQTTLRPVLVPAVVIPPLQTITNRTLSRPTRQLSGQKVRLSNGTEGRLEVLIGGEWGSVCRYGFDIEDAAVACHQMGLALNTRDWLLESSEFMARGPLMKVLLNNVQCDHLDTDLTRCRAERASDFERSCIAEVGIRCYPTSWAGVRLGMMAEYSELEHLIIERSGLLDYSTHRFKAALQIDFNRHRVRDLQVRDNFDAGIEILWNEIFNNRENLRIIRSEIIGNQYHGLVTRSQGLQVSHCLIRGNRGSGFHYLPAFNRLEQSELISWVQPNHPSLILRVPGPRKTFYISPRLNPHNFWYLVVDDDPSPMLEEQYDIETDRGTSLGIMVLNPIFEDSSENLTIQGGNFFNAPKWDLKRNLTAFPLLNYGYRLTIHYKSGKRPRGGIILFLTTKDLPRPRIPLETQEDILLQEQRLMKTISLEENVIETNGRGVSANHFNHDLSSNHDYYHRYNNESIVLRGNRISRSQAEAMLIYAPIHQYYPGSLQLQLAEINYTLVNNRIDYNQAGLVQYNRDARDSNNLFHWVINNTLMENNLNGGFTIKLPYVWQYNENYTHTVDMYNNTIVRNQGFQFQIDGHFARVNISRNVFKENRCKLGLFLMSGMEKEMKIWDNVFEENQGQFAIEFAIDSHADQFGQVPANFFLNVIRSNRPHYDQLSLPFDPKANVPNSYGMALRGVQLVNITRNIMNNPNMEYEFVAGVLIGSLDVSVNVAENWWGTANSTAIERRIFDFDDWNNYAMAYYSPVLAYESLLAGAIPIPPREWTITDYYLPLGGKIIGNLALKAKPDPYLVMSDLTVMPNSTLVIHEGVILEFYPNVGILVLGDLIAAGHEDLPIIMRPASLLNFPPKRYKRQNLDRYDRLLHAVGMGSVRLCKTEPCDNGQVDQGHDGFLEIFNTTSLEWVPICDPQFSHRSAQVVCRQLGYSPVNVFLRRGPRQTTAGYVMGQSLISRVKHWPPSLECQGDETSLSECELKLYIFDNQTNACSYDSDEFVYINCGPKQEHRERQYWAGVRFASPVYELQTFENQAIPARPYPFVPRSRMEFVIIEGAGSLHGERTAAIQMIQRHVNLEYVTVRNCGHHGIELVTTTTESILFHKLTVADNLGIGLNYLVLNGASTASNDLPYQPLVDSTLPYGPFGIINICDPIKELILDERVLIYFKADTNSVDCVKIFTSRDSIKQIGFRLLQFKLMNTTGTNLRQSDGIKIYDGHIFNQTTKLISFISRQQPSSIREFYSSTYSSLTVQLHSSGARDDDYGFIAEVVTLPVSYLIHRNVHHNVTYSLIANNTRGAINYRTAGESAPAISMGHNQIKENCAPLYGNWTTCRRDAAARFELQNAQYFYFRNNWLYHNYGGMGIKSESRSAIASLNAILTNNVFAGNQIDRVLEIRGPEVGSYQTADIQRNYFTSNEAQFKSNIVLARIVANFTENIVVNNKGWHQLEVTGFERVPLSYQSCKKNWFYNNIATAREPEAKSTIFASNAGQLYEDNYLVNPANDFELATGNRSDISLRTSAVIARKNWWGFNGTSAVAGRIHDWYDSLELVPVEYTPYYEHNSSVLSESCTGGWEAIGETCFAYVGASLSYWEAKEFCEKENSSMPYVRSSHEGLTAFLYKMQDNFDMRIHRVWVQSFDIPAEECAVLVNGRVRRHTCHDRLPFLCERDGQIEVSLNDWFKEPLGIAALAISSLMALFTLIFILCWLAKSRQKHEEKLQRRNSIRSSIRSNRTPYSLNSSTATLTDLGGFRRGLDDRQHQMFPMPTTSSQIQRPAQYRGQNGHTNGIGSLDSIKKVPSMTLTTGTTATSYTADTGDTHSYTLSDRFAADPGLENANVEALVRPTFDLTYENRGFGKPPPPAPKPRLPSSPSKASTVQVGADASSRQWPSQTTDNGSLWATRAADSPAASSRYAAISAASSVHPSPSPIHVPRQPLPSAAAPSATTSAHTAQILLTFRQKTPLQSQSSINGSLSEKKLLETSLDGDLHDGGGGQPSSSAMDLANDTGSTGYFNQYGRYSPTSTSSVSITSSRDTYRSRLPLETAM